MIILDSTSKSLVAKMTGAPSANQPEFTVHYADVGSSFAEKSEDGTLNGTTEVELVAAPSGTNRRIIKDVTIYNADTAEITFILQVKNGASYRTLYKRPLDVEGTFSLERVEAGTGSGGVTDHGDLSGLTDDDHTQYVHRDTARTISAVHTLNPSSAGAPFSLGANAQGQLVTGLNADQLDSKHLQDIVDDYIGDFIDGGTLANNATDANNDIDFAAIRTLVRDGTHRYAIKTTSTMVKRLDASWAAGTNQGGLFSGSKAADTSYHCFVIRKDSDGTIDFGFDTSVTAANKPSGYSAYRRILTIRTDASGNIRPFDQWGDEILYYTPPLDVDYSNPGTSANTLTLHSVPPDVEVLAIFEYFYYVPNVAKGMVFTSMCQQDQAPSYTGTPLADDWTDGGTADNRAGRRRVRTNTSKQIRFRQQDANTSVIIRIATHGWVDPRGRDW